jgi:hypothetical protein
MSILNTLRVILIYTLFILLLVIQSLYIALVEGAVLWCLWNLLITQIFDITTVTYLAIVGIAFIPNFIYTLYHVHRVWRELV